MYIDSIAGVLISMWIMNTAVRLFIESYDVLMDKSMDNSTKEKVLKIIDKPDTPPNTKLLGNKKKLKAKENRNIPNIKYNILIRFFLEK